MAEQPFVKAPDFFDGTSAKRHEVSVTASIEGLRIENLQTGKVDFWPLAELRQMPDQARGGGMLLSRSTLPDARLSLYDVALCDEVRKVCPDLNKVEVKKGAIRQLFVWGGAAIASIVLILFVIIPGLANTMATLIPVEREVALGKGALKQIERLLAGDILGREGKSLVCENPAGLAALDKMTARLTRGLDTPYDLEIKVFDHEMVNAFAVPGGHIVLIDGLIQKATSAEEVAGVLGHEMGHVINRDSTRAMLRTAGSAGILGMVFGDFAGGAAVLLASEQLMNASYAQKAETNADIFAHERFAEAMLPATKFADFFLRLKEEFGDTEGFMSHLASHPDLQGRADAAIRADVIGFKSFTPVLSAQEWNDLREICDG